MGPGRDNPGGNVVARMRQKCRGPGLLANVSGTRHTSPHLDLPRGDPPPRDLRGIGDHRLAAVAVYEADHNFMAPSSRYSSARYGAPALGIVGAQMNPKVLGAVSTPASGARSGGT